jgi:hypothetical protein
MKTIPLLLIALSLGLSGCKSHPCLLRSYMPAENYWAGIVWGPPMGMLAEGSTDEALCVSVQLEEGQEFYRVAKRVLTRQGKEDAFRNLVEMRVLRLQEEAAVTRSMEDLRRLTGMSFNSPQQWVRWWKEYHGLMRLTPDGRFLQVRRPETP